MSETVKVLNEGYIKLIDTFGSDESIIEAARTSTNKGFIGWGPMCTACDMPWGGSSPCQFCNSVINKPKAGDEKLLNYLWKNKHVTPFEFGGLIVEMQAPIFIWREIIRHRSLAIASVNEISARYAPLPNLNYIPSLERLMQSGDGSNKQAGVIEGAPTLTLKVAEEYLNLLTKQYENQQDLYEWALNNGVPKELARIHVGVGRYTRARIQTSLRNWLAFLELRQPSNVQFECRVYADVMAGFIKEEFPKTYEVYEKNLI